MIETTDDVDRAYIEARFLPAMDLVARYHRFRIHGIENVPRSGAALIVASHSLITYDFLLATAAIYRGIGRVMRPLGDHFWFRFRPISRAFAKVGVVRASPETGRALLDRGELVAVGPGGMWEALRPSRERFQLRWEGRRGFARLALETKAPIVLGTCPASDLALTVYESRITDEIYRRFKLPVPIARGLGPTLVPRPVALTAHFSEPIEAPAIAGDTPTEDEVASHAVMVRERMRRLIEEAIREDGL
jgi:1-acyl-sn-glycerol-3-phosphate acyltransferase